MLFGWKKKRKLAEEVKKREEQRIKEDTLLEAMKESYAYADNINTFYRICDMVRSLPKKRKIVVVQRKNIFKDDSDRNWCYLKTAREMASQHRLNGATRIVVVITLCMLSICLLKLMTILVKHLKIFLRVATIFNEFAIII